MLLRAEGVKRQYFRQSKDRNVFTALQKTDFVLKEAAVTAIMGRSGSGKSTFLNILAGLLQPTEGKVFLDDTDLYALEDGERSRIRNRHFGIIPQGQTGLHSLTVMENVLLPLKMYGSEDREEEALKLLERTGIANLRHAYPNELSGGEMRRMAIARALIHRPQILLADEPTGDLDDENTGVVLKLLRECADQGIAVLLVTHEHEAVKYADDTLKMDAGILACDKI